VERGKLLFSTKNREAWSLFSAKLVIRIIFRPDDSPRPSGTVCLARLNALHTYVPLAQKPPRLLPLRTKGAFGICIRRSPRASRYALPARQNLKEKAFQVFGLRNMGKDRMVERLKKLLQHPHVAPCVYARVHDHFQKHFAGNMM
jgi:hypothetical protein